MNLPLTRIEIEKFRGLRDVKLEDMGQVNLIVGVNNSGKTSVLEAISTVCQPLVLRSYVEIARQRESVMSKSAFEDHYQWLFSQELKPGEVWFGQNRVSASGAIDVLDVSASAQFITKLSPIFTQIGEDEFGEPEMEQVDSEVVGGIRFKFAALLKSAELEQVSEVEIWQDSPLIPKDHLQSPAGCKVLNLSPYSHRLQRRLIEDLSQALEDDWSDEVNMLLAEIDPSIQKLILLSKERIHLRHSELGSMPIQSFGDGVRRAILYALSVPAVKGGVLLIDEIESAIHVTALPKVFRWLVAACKRFDVQLIATTHSLEAVDAVIEGMEEASDLVAYRLESKRGKIAANRIAGDLLRRMRFDRGLEVR